MTFWVQYIRRQTKNVRGKQYTSNEMVSLVNKGTTRNLIIINTAIANKFIFYCCWCSQRHHNHNSLPSVLFPFFFDIEYGPPVYQAIEIQQTISSRSGFLFKFEYALLLMVSREEAMDQFLEDGYKKNIRPCYINTKYQVMQRNELCRPSLTLPP